MTRIERFRNVFYKTHLLIKKSGKSLAKSIDHMKFYDGYIKYLYETNLLAFHSISTQIKIIFNLITTTLSKTWEFISYSKILYHYLDFSFYYQNNPMVKPPATIYKHWNYDFLKMFTLITGELTLYTIRYAPFMLITLDMIKYFFPESSITSFVLGFMREVALYELTYPPYGWKDTAIYMPKYEDIFIDPQRYLIPLKYELGEYENIIEVLLAEEAFLDAEVDKLLEKLNENLPIEVELTPDQPEILDEEQKIEEQKKSAEKKKELMFIVLHCVVTFSVCMVVSLTIANRFF